MEKKDIDLPKCCTSLNSLTKKEDMDSLIKSATLLNAAIARNPNNVSEIQEDMRRLCGHVLRVGDAERKDADLVKKANEIKRVFVEMRQKVNESLQNIKPISDKVEGDALLRLEREKVEQIKQIQSRIILDYKLIMSSLCDYCIQVMGDAPCKFAHVGMGSMASLEITPYSDYENIILLEEGCQENDQIYHERVLPFFRSYSAIFQVVFINLQENILPSVNIVSLKDTTTKEGERFFHFFPTRDLSFNGLMPHACQPTDVRQQPTQSKQWSIKLIKPASEMLQYLETNKEKDGYHFADISTKNCFVYGERSIYDQLCEVITKKLNSSDESTLQKQIVSQIKEDLDNFSVKFSLSKTPCAKTFNFARIMFHSSGIFIAALSRLYKVLGNSCFEILEGLEEKGALSSDARRRLAFSVALNYEVRLKLNMKSEEQSDMAENTSEGEYETAGLIAIMRQASFIRYFRIMYSLKCEICRILNIKENKNNSDLRLVNVVIYEGLGLKNKAKQLLNRRSKELSEEDIFRDFDSCLHRLESISQEDQNLQTEEEAPTSVEFGQNGEHSLRVCNSLFQDKQFNDAVEHGQKCLNSDFFKSVDKDALKTKARVLFCVGSSLREMKKFHEAVYCLDECLELEIELFIANDDIDEHVARTCNQLGWCLMSIGSHKEAMSHFEIMLKAYEAMSDETTDRSAAQMLNEIGLCLKTTKRYNDAVRYLKKSLKIYQTNSSDQDKDREVADALMNIGVCLKNKGQNEEALIPLKKAQGIYKRICSSEETEREVAVAFHHIGVCLQNRRQHDKAMVSLENSLRIYQSISTNRDSDRDVANALNSIGLFLKDVGRYDEVMMYLKKSLYIFRRTSSNEDTDRDVAAALRNIGVCLDSIAQYGEALIYFEKSLKIYQKTSFNEKIDRDVASTLNSIGVCLDNARRSNEAMAYLEKSLKIYQRTTFSEETDLDVADVLHNIGVCLRNAKEFDDAETYFEDSNTIKYTVKYTN